MRLIVFSDIDDTLMQTARKCVGQPDLLPGAYDKNGSAASFTTEAQRAMARLLQDNAYAFVPVTARSRDGLARVDLGKPFSSGAVVDFGAGVLNEDSSYDQVWTDKLLACEKPESLHRTFSSLRTIVEQHWELQTHRIQESNGFPAYLLLRPSCANSLSAIANYVAELLDADRPNSYYLHVTDRDVCVLPEFVNKGEAAAYMLQKHGWESDLLVALGDSLSDLSFMKSAHFMVAPSRSRLAEHSTQLAKARRELP